MVHTIQFKIRIPRIIVLMFFDRLYVRDGQIDHYVPRADRREEVEDLIRFATGGRLEVEVLAPIPRKGRSWIVAKSGKGGIRTLEGALHPLPA